MAAASDAKTQRSDDDNGEPTKPELQEQLRDAGESTTGTKAELEERVENLEKRHVPDVFVVQRRPK